MTVVKGYEDQNQLVKFRANNQGQDNISDFKSNIKDMVIQEMELRK